LYNGDSKPEFFDPKNFLKAIKTIAGHTLKFNDQPGMEGITMNDRNGNQMKIDTDGNNVTITALQTLTLNAANLNINVGENMTVKIGGSQETNIEEDMKYVMKGNTTITTEGKTEIQM